MQLCLENRTFHTVYCTSGYYCTFLTSILILDQGNYICNNAYGMHVIVTNHNLKDYWKTWL